MNVFIALCLVDLVYGNKCEPLCVCIFVFPTSFDLLAVGGISVTLLFQRAPFLSQIRSVWLPWNQFMVLDRVIMERAESKPPVCDLKNLISPHAIVLSAPLPRFAADCEDRGSVVPELQVRDTFTLEKTLDAIS